MEDKLEEAYYVPPPPENDFEILSMAEVNIGGASTPKADLTSHPSTPGPKQEVLAPDLEDVKVPDGCDCDVFDVSPLFSLTHPFFWRKKELLLNREPSSIV